MAIKRGLRISLEDIGDVTGRLGFCALPFVSVRSGVVAPLACSLDVPDAWPFECTLVVDTDVERGCKARLPERTELAALPFPGEGRESTRESERDGGGKKVSGFMVPDTDVHA